METLILHEYSPSGNCYKVRLTAAHLDVILNRREYDLLKGETRTPEFLRQINPNGKIPVLQIGHHFLPEGNAACFYLADGSSLIPTDRYERAEMLQWMFFEQYSHEPNMATLRYWLAYLGKEQLDDLQRLSIPAKRTNGESALKLMDLHLSERQFFVSEKLTLADISLYAYTHVAEEAGFALADYPHVAAWVKRVSAQPRHIAIAD